MMVRNNEIKKVPVGTKEKAKSPNKTDGVRTSLKASLSLCFICLLWASFARVNHDTATAISYRSTNKVRSVIPEIIELRGDVALRA